MLFDDKIFEFVILEPEKFDCLNKAIEKVCEEHRVFKIRSALISKIIVDANECTDEQILRNFLKHYQSFYDICKIHLQFPHDLLFPADVECVSENVPTPQLSCGFLYNYNFMQTSTILQNKDNFSLEFDCDVAAEAPNDEEPFTIETYGIYDAGVTYPNTNWFHDQGILRLTLPQHIYHIFDPKLGAVQADIKFEFDYSSFIKIYIHQRPNRNELTLTVAVGNPPAIYIRPNKGPSGSFVRIHDMEKESFWKSLIRSSAIQLNLSFANGKKCRDFLSHLHFAASCPIVFLCQLLDSDTPTPLALSSPNVSHLSWEVQYGIQMIIDCGDIGIYYFNTENFIRKLLNFVEEEKLADALALLSAIHANLKLQPMMESIMDPIPIMMNVGADYVWMRTVIITPTRTICCPPMQLMSSRAFKILGGAEKFIQVKFRDENMQMMKRDESMMREVVMKPGMEGITIAGKSFFDLARSNSMFREHGTYFYQAETMDGIVEVLRSLGKFKCEPSSKTAARVGQYFTSQRDVKRKLRPSEYTVIPDDMSESTNGLGENYCFSDGVGIISQQFAMEIQTDLKISYLPSAFQIRCLGFKGVLSIDHRHPRLIDAGGDKLILFRESQKKFDVDPEMEVVLGIVKYSAPGLVRFNKPLINLWDQTATKQGLSSIFDKRVNELFSETFYNITLPLTSNKKFNELLERLPTYCNFQRTIRQVWINEPFFRSMVTASAMQQLSSLQIYKQISLPSDLGRSMLGIVDVTGLLEEGQVFVQYSKHMSSSKSDAEKCICKGKVAVSRSPIYNIGDLRILEAVDILELHHLFDVIIFPNHGSRPAPDEMSGGDLDVDEYSVVWDPKLMLHHSEKAADYTPAEKNPSIDRIEDLPENSAKFRFEYMMCDNLAEISNCHFAHSDLHGLEHNEVKELAGYADIAVNYFKSGIAAKKLDKEEMCDWYPDFMDKSHLPSYTSPRLLGRLHRKCDRIWNICLNIVNENKVIQVPLDPGYNIEGWEEYRDEATMMYKHYNAEIEHLKSTYGIKNEGELFSNQLGNILGRLRNFEPDNTTANSAKSLIQIRVSEIFCRYRNCFLASIGEAPNTKVIECISMKAKQLAIAYYKVAYGDGGSLSFPWIAWEVLDSVWSTDSESVVSAHPIYDLIDENFDGNDAGIDPENPSANVIKFARRIVLWLKKFEYKIEEDELKIVLHYFFKLDTHSDIFIDHQFACISKFGKKLIQFFASIGSFEFLEQFPKLKFIHEAAQETYCRIVFSPFSLNKPNPFKQRKFRGNAFVVAIPRHLSRAFFHRKTFLLYQSGCNQLSFRIRKQNCHHIHFFVWSHGTRQQNDKLKEILTIAPEIQESLSFEEVRKYKHSLQWIKIFQE